MKTIFQLTLLLTISTIAMGQNTFRKDQLLFGRVREAYTQKWDGLKKELEKNNFKGNFQLYISAYKAEGKLELWLKSQGDQHFKLFKTCDFCAYSGTLGPKVIEGDGQTPEGFYKINVFNPMSNFHLSLGVDYPNKVDLARTGTKNKPGGDIYIHGNCVTIGCIPLTDEKIKEVYIMAVEARNGGQTAIPVYIFPFRMTNANMKKYIALQPSQAVFWKNLQDGYKILEREQQPVDVKQIGGLYIVSSSPSVHEHGVEK